MPADMLLKLENPSDLWEAGVGRHYDGMEVLGPQGVVDEQDPISSLKENAGASGALNGECRDHRTYEGHHPPAPIGDPLVKTAVLETLNALQASVPLNTPGEAINDSRGKQKAANDLIASTRHDLNSVSETGDTESLRLQMAMDRLSKLMSTLSNVLKKASDTSQTITQNLK